MINLKIDNKEISVKEGTTILQAAQELGIKIPTMCFKEGHHNHPSCMVCLVKNVQTGNLIPSCGFPASESMEIITLDEEVQEARKEALELLLSDHVGDCEAPCQIGCPANMNIPKMNRLIGQKKFDEAIKVVKEDIALPLILGYICSAPCEKACHRKEIDSEVAICQLKKFVSKEKNNSDLYLPEKKATTGKKIAIIGSGPAGLSAAFYTLKNGHEVTIFEKENRLGGTLNDLTEDILPASVLKAETDLIEKYGAKVLLNSNIDVDYFNSKIKNEFDAIIIAFGEIENENPFGLKSTKTGIEANTKTFESSNEGIFVCGSAIKKVNMAIRALAQGKEAANSVNDFLIGHKPKGFNRMFNSKYGKFLEEEYFEFLKEASKENLHQPKNGKLDGFDEVEAIKEAQRCLHCDCRKPKTCKLRILADEYNADRKKYILNDRLAIKKYLEHEFVVFEPNKCIKCNLCIDIANSHKEEIGLTNIGRGFNVQIAVPFHETIHEALTIAAKECIESCPTGALAYK